MMLGCAAPPPPPLAKVAALPAPPSPTPVVPQARLVPVPEHKPAPPPEPSGAAPERVAVALPQAAQGSPTALSPAQHAQLIGIDLQAATRLLGTAAERSERPPATVWRWRSATCELDLYFYLDLRSGQMRSLHYAFKSQNSGLSDCLKSLALAGPG